MFRQFGNLEEFYEKRPNLNPHQLKILNAYYDARRDCSENRYLTQSELKTYCGSILYDADIAVFILKQVDNHFLTLKREAMEADKGQQ